MRNSSIGITTRTLATLFLTGALAALGVSLPAAAGAYATVAPPPTPSASSGLPDGRVYELVSPANKHGYQAGAEAELSSSEPLVVKAKFSIASADGDAVAFRSSGPAADRDSSGLNENFVAERTSTGWTSRSTTARGLRQNETLSLFIQNANWSDYSPDLSRLAYDAGGAEVPGAPANGTANYYLLGSNPLEEPTWLLRSVASPSLYHPIGGPNTELVGMSPDGSVVYFAWEGGLLPQDASRSGWGLYESRHGVVSEAGVLPDGSVPVNGAMPFATDTPSGGGAYRQGQNNPASFDNQLSEDGMRVFFISSGELYVHKIESDGSEHSVLVSASQLPGHVGEAASDGVVQFENLTHHAIYGWLQSNEGEEKSKPTYGYASADGSHVFFQSTDQLTSEAPAGSELKVYDFDVDSGSLEYLPGVELEGIVTATKDGSSFVFVDGAGSPADLDLWSAGSNGGSVSQIARLPGLPGGFVGPGRMVDGDSVLVFQTSAPIAGFNDGGTHLAEVGSHEIGAVPGTEQVFRYDIKTNVLACISCPPAGVKPTGNAYLSAIDQYGNRYNAIVQNLVVNDARGVSSDGERIFFGSPDPLVGRDSNGLLDAYEWEDGKVFLISSGTSSEYSLFLDNSESGGDVFFATSDALTEGDSDAGFDVYDARIPRPGDSPPPAAVPCSGDVCQGPPSVAQLLGAPPSATFNGAGNAVEVPVVRAKSAPKQLTMAQKLAGALSACRQRKPKHRRVACEKQARKRYSAIGRSTKRNGRRGK